MSLEIRVPDEACVVIVDGPASAQTGYIWTDTTKPSIQEMTRMQRLVFATRLREIAQDLEMHDILGMGGMIGMECSE